MRQHGGDENDRGDMRARACGARSRAQQSRVAFDQWRRAPGHSTHASQAEHTALKQKRRSQQHGKGRPSKPHPPARLRRRGSLCARLQRVRPLQGVAQLRLHLVALPRNLLVAVVEVLEAPRGVVKLVLELSYPVGCEKGLGVRCCRAVAGSEGREASAPPRLACP